MKFGEKKIKYIKKSFLQNKQPCILQNKQEVRNYNFFTYITYKHK